MAQQALSEVLAIGFTCATTINKGDDVVISAANTVALMAAEASLDYVGRVVVHRDGATECTVETPFRYRPLGDDRRLSGAAVAVGPFVFDAAGKVINYDADVHSPAAIRGILITTANAADVRVETLEY